MEFDCGVMISASHNPYYDNGIKLINGQRREDGRVETIALVEAYLDGELEAVRQEMGPEVPFAKTGADRSAPWIMSPEETVMSAI